jgi:hypothetical protein
VKCFATEPIDDPSTGKLMEGVLAAFAQLDNDVARAPARVPHLNSADGAFPRQSDT